MLPALAGLAGGPRGAIAPVGSRTLAALGRAAGAWEASAGRGGGGFGSLARGRDLFAGIVRAFGAGV